MTQDKRIVNILTKLLFNEARTDVLHFVNTILPVGEVLEPSWYKLEKSMDFNNFKYVNSLQYSQPNSLYKFDYCNYCHHLYEYKETMCPICGISRFEKEQKIQSFFYMKDLKEIQQQLYKGI